MLYAIWTLALWLGVRCDQARASRCARRRRSSRSSALACTVKTDELRAAAGGGARGVIGLVARRPSRGAAMLRLAAAVVVPVALDARRLGRSSRVLRTDRSRRSITQSTERGVGGTNWRELLSYVWQYYLPRHAGPDTTIAFRVEAASRCSQVWITQGWAAFGWLEIKFAPWVYWVLGVLTAAIGGRGRGRAGARPAARSTCASPRSWRSACVALLAGLHWTDYHELETGAPGFMQAPLPVPGRSASSGSRWPARSRSSRARRAARSPAPRSRGLLVFHLLCPRPRAGAVLCVGRGRLRAVFLAGARGARRARPHARLELVYSLGVEPAPPVADARRAATGRARRRSALPTAPRSTASAFTARHVRRARPARCASRCVDGRRAARWLGGRLAPAATPTSADAREHVVPVGRVDTGDPLRVCLVNEGAAPVAVFGQAGVASPPTTRDARRRRSTSTSRSTLRPRSARWSRCCRRSPSAPPLFRAGWVTPGRLSPARPWASSSWRRCCWREASGGLRLTTATLPPQRRTLDQPPRQQCEGVRDRKRDHEHDPRRQARAPQRGDRLLDGERVDVDPVRHVAGRRQPAQRRPACGRRTR